MPYHLTREPDLVRIVYFGIITPPDLQAIAGEIKAIELARGAARNRLIDLSQVSRMDLSYPVLRTFKTRRKAQPSTHPVRSAIVASQPVHVGFAMNKPSSETDEQAKAPIVIEIIESSLDSSARQRPRGALGLIRNIPTHCIHLRQGFSQLYSLAIMLRTPEPLLLADQVVEAP